MQYVLQYFPFRSTFNISTFQRCFIIVILICIIFFIHMNTTRLRKEPDRHPPGTINNSIASSVQKSRGPPYLTFIISSVSHRFNRTFYNLNIATPGYFNIQQRRPVLKNDSRITVNRDTKVASLLLTYVDLWDDIGARPESELRDNDWIFIFEDDVNIVPLEVVENFYPDIHTKWNYSNPNTSIAGWTRFLLQRIFSYAYSYKKIRVIIRLESFSL